MNKWIKNISWGSSQGVLLFFHRRLVLSNIEAISNIGAFKIKKKWSRKFSSLVSVARATCVWRLLYWTESLQNIFAITEIISQYAIESVFVTTNLSFGCNYYSLSNCKSTVSVYTSLQSYGLVRSTVFCPSTCGPSSMFCVWVLHGLSPVQLYTDSFSQWVALSTSTHCLRPETWMFAFSYCPTFLAPSSSSHVPNSLTLFLCFN
jgi:hypothetical protein